MDDVTNDAGRWGVRWTPAPSARLRLFCLPHAGGGAAVYRQWARDLAPDIEVVAIRLPGREARFGEPAYHSMTELVPALVHGLSPWLDKPHAWYGHSMGALIAFEVCRELRRLRFPPPERLLVSGHAAPHLPLRRPPVHEAPTDELVRRLQQLSDAPVEVLSDPAVIAALLPTLRADFAVFETYRHTDEPPLEHPITVFTGDRDEFATAAELAAWQRHTAAAWAHHVLQGDHFFPHRERARFLRVLTSELHPANGGVLDGQPH
ncbi:thioesterase II family protein [Actinomadura sp. 3N508]|uniref:thioesterase II family protein n=1 Tax=Actinomadura sp. 3N508 TaxID=3375153 RepID=UPI0037A3AC93